MAAQPVPPAIAKIAPDGNLTPRQTRHFLIEMSLRRQKPGTGSSLEFLQKRTALIAWPDLRECLSGIRWAVVGAVATRAYMPERATGALDILVQPQDKREAVRRLELAGFKWAADSDNVLRSIHGADVRVLTNSSIWVEQALASTESDPAGLPVLSLPFLVLMKLQASRSKDWADIPLMLALANDDVVNQVRTVVARYSPEDSGDLESSIFIGQKERELPPDAE